MTLPRVPRLGLRARLTLLATVVVAVTLAIAAGLLLVVVRHSVLNSLDESARQQAKDVAALARSGRLPDPIPVGTGTAGVQIVDAQGRVTAVSAGADRLTGTAWGHTKLSATPTKPLGQTFTINSQSILD